ncbi:MAG: polysaccharide biosynthesis/export family protein [Gemmataceae bacterium]
MRGSLILAGFLCSSLVGCSGGPSALLGTSPAQHKLLPEAKLFRELGPTPPPRELAKELLGPYIVEPGDTLLVQTVELDAPVRFPGDQPVLPDGTIDLNGYGRPVVAGKTVAEIETELKALIAQKTKEAKKDPFSITVRLINRQSKVFYVLGEVNAPGAFPLAGRETVLDAILVAGGLSRRAHEKKILLSRPTGPEGCRVVLPVCYPQIVQLGDTTTNYQIQPGDRIYVPSREWGDDFSFFEAKHAKNACGPCLKPQLPCMGGASCR